jgi:hypothetical protein
MARGFRIGHPIPGTYSVTAAAGAYVESGKDATLTHSEAGSGGNVGQVGSYANMDLDTYPIYSIDMGLNDYGIMRTQGSDEGTGTSTHVASSWPLGGVGYCRITPPTTAGYERGINVSNIWQSGTLAIQDFNVRWEWRANSTFCSMAGTGPKFAIIHTARSLASENADDRPVMFLRPMDTADNSSLNRANTLVTCPAMDTTQGWGNAVYDDASTFDDPPGTLTYYPNSIQPYYHTNDGDTGTFQGNPKVEVGEVITFEMRVLTTASVAYPRGLIAMRMYRENGFVAERGIPWDWDTSVPLGSYVQEVQQFGCGQWNALPGSNVQWMDVGGYVTLARDLNGWLGRRNAA